MSEHGDVKVMTLALGAFNGATHVPLAKIPAGFGGITILEAALVGPSAGTAVAGLLVKLTDAGTPAISGTIGAFTTPGVTAAGVPIACTLSTPYVDADTWIGYDQTSGTVPAGTFITLSYVMGK